jgi:hypothetical protein
MPLSEIKSIPEFEDIIIEQYTNSFVPYLYLDGHRSSSIGDSDAERYNSGFEFFQRFGRIMKQMGFKNMITMVHTSRNCKVKGRLDSIHSAIQQNFNSLNHNSESNFKLYGDLESYKNMGLENFYNFIKKIESLPPEQNSFTNHILINYSENWALKNLEKLNSIPHVSTVIRFTKGFVSGGWIPQKMQEATFIYSQIPSVSEFWSDEAITILILIALKNWSLMVNNIGKKEYEKGEKELIHNKRDLDLNFYIKKIDINKKMHNRIIAFSVYGPVLYEL